MSDEKIPQIPRPQDEEDSDHGESPEAPGDVGDFSSAAYQPNLEALKAATDASAALLDSLLKPITPDSRPQSFLLIYNISKRANIGCMVRSAVAMGATAVLLVGAKKINLFGNKGAERFIPFIHFNRIYDIIPILKQREIHLLGVEILPEAKNLLSMDYNHIFHPRTCFVLGNEGSGLNETIKPFCEDFLYIPQFSTGTASLNVATTATIFLLFFAQWGKFEEIPRQGEKFLVEQENPNHRWQNNPNAIGKSQRVLSNEERKKITGEKRKPGEIPHNGEKEEKKSRESSDNIQQQEKE